MTAIPVSVLLSERGPWGAALIPIALLTGCALFLIRGYTVEAGGLTIRRLFWTHRVPLEGLQEVRWDPEAMRGSVRLFGNGGVFSFSGLFWNRKLGKYRAFVTDPSRAVVLRLSRRTVVVSPADPEAFIREVEERVR